MKVSFNYLKKKNEEREQAAGGRLRSFVRRTTYVDNGLRICREEAGFWELLTMQYLPQCYCSNIESRVARGRVYIHQPQSTTLESSNGCVQIYYMESLLSTLYALFDISARATRRDDTRRNRRAIPSSLQTLFLLTSSRFLRIPTLLYLLPLCFRSDGGALR